MDYLILRLIHITAVVVFLGNIMTGLFWAARAHNTRNLDLIAATFGSIIRSDRWFTTPGVVGILVSGFAMADVADLPVLGTSWILWPIVLFSISGIVFAARVAPLQKRILRLTSTAVEDESVQRTYDKLFRRWELWGIVAIATPALALIVMVLKPALPGL